MLTFVQFAHNGELKVFAVVLWVIKPENCGSSSGLQAECCEKEELRYSLFR